MTHGEAKNSTSDLRGPRPALPWFGGLPFGPDITRLLDKFGIPKSGDLIRYADIAATIGAEWKTTRFDAVVGDLHRGWRGQLMRDHNIDTVRDPDAQAVRVLTAPERITVGESDFKATVRKGRRTAIRVQVIPDEGLSDEQKKRRDHVRTVISRVYMVAANEARGLRPPEPPKALPRAPTQG